MSLEREIAGAERSFTDAGPGPHQEINEQTNSYVNMIRHSTATKRLRRRPNHRMICRRNQAVFILAMALCASVILNVCLVMR